MINGIKKETIVSTTEDRLTLLQWLKKLEKTLSDDTLTDIAFTDNNGNVSLVLTFEDGTTKSVAFPYDMSEFAKKEDLSKPLEFKSKLDLNDRAQFDLEEGADDFNYYLKIELENGIYPLDISSIGDTGTKGLFINFGLANNDKLNYKYLQVINPQTQGSLQAFDIDNGYCNGLNGSNCYVLLSKEFNNFSYFIIINNGIVTFTISQEI